MIRETAKHRDWCFRCWLAREHGKPLQGMKCPDKSECLKIQMAEVIEFKKEGTTMTVSIWTAVAALFVGLGLGQWAANRYWREKGDHPYMNRMESGGRLYLVRREDLNQ